MANWISRHFQFIVHLFHFRINQTSHQPQCANDLHQNNKRRRSRRINTFLQHSYIVKKTLKIRKFCSCSEIKHFELIEENQNPIFSFIEIEIIFIIFPSCRSVVIFANLQCWTIFVESFRQIQSMISKHLTIFLKKKVKLCLLWCHHDDDTGDIQNSTLTLAH